MTVYQPFKIALSAGQQDNLREAVATKTGVTLRLNPEQFGKGDPLPLTSTHIGRIKKAAGAGHGIDLKMSKAQLTKLAQSGGNLFSTALSLALPLLAPAAKAAGKALATAGLSFGAEKRLKKIFGNGYGPREVQLYQLVQSLNPAQKKKLEQHLVGKGLVRGGDSGQYGGFLGMLTSMFGKGMHVRLRRSAPPPPPPPRRTGGKGMHVRPPPFFGSWDDKKMAALRGPRPSTQAVADTSPPRFKDFPLSNIDLLEWCDFLQIPLKGIFSRNEAKPLHHSPCIINMDDFGCLGTHWICCWPGKQGMEYFNPFGMPPPLEWEKEMRPLGHKTFLRNDNQIQAVDSVRCGYYCVLFLNERNRGISFTNLKKFSTDVQSNERVLKSYFLHIR